MQAATICFAPATSSRPTNRELLRELLRIAAPLMLGNLFYSLQITVDRIFLTRFDPDAPLLDLVEPADETDRLPLRCRRVPPSPVPVRFAIVGGPDVGSNDRVNVVPDVLVQACRPAILQPLWQVRRDHGTRGH